MNPRLVVGLSILCLAAPVALAHHSSAGIYDLSGSITVEGVVTEYRFVSPHARVLFNVTDETGKTQTWLAEGANAVALRLLGWTGSEMKPGDKIVVTGAPSRNGSPRVEWREITLPDGRRIGGGNNLPRERSDLLQRLEEQRRHEASQQ
jgi:hypothetical protein